MKKTISFAPVLIVVTNRGIADKTALAAEGPFF